ncbi:MAG: CopG family transcriptional regulator [Candidatus Omnitrophica bacterium]|nr:CopG family transcriptional regulator [Candidatus Omnitrophota bacterium]MBI3010767.1 CopG family transcriptional regulator [Candidatus Omnitrophota bacterium]
MNKRMIDSNFPIGRLTRIKDILPPPDKLVIPEDNVKVTLFLSKSSVRFFKQQAARHQTKYQRMLRELVDRYAERFSE